MKTITQNKKRKNRSRSVALLLMLLFALPAWAQTPYTTATGLDVTTIMNSDSRIFYTIVEDGDEVQVQVMATGTLKTQQYDVVFKYDRSKVAPMAGSIEITSSLDTANAQYQAFAPFNSNFPNNWMIAEASLNVTDGTVKHIATGTYPSVNTVFSNASSDIVLLNTFYFKKKETIAIDSATFQFHSLTEGAFDNLLEASAVWHGIGNVAQDSIGNANPDFHIVPELFWWRTPSHIELLDSIVDFSSVTLNGHVAGGYYGEDNDLNFGRDTVKTYGFFYGSTTAKPTVNIAPYSDSIVVNGDKYLFPTDLTKPFICGTDTFYIVYTNNEDGTALDKNYSNKIIDLKSDTKYYYWGFMQYRFQTSTTYPAITPIDSLKTLSAPELVFVKQPANPDTICSGSQTQFMLVVKNNSTNEVTYTDVEVKTSFQGGLTDLVADPASDYDAPTGIWTISSLSKDQTDTLRLTVIGTSPSLASIILTDTARIISANGNDIAVANQQVNIDSVLVNPLPQVTLGEVIPSFVCAGEEASLIISSENGGNKIVYDLSFDKGATWPVTDSLVAKAEQYSPYTVTFKPLDTTYARVVRVVNTLTGCVNDSASLKEKTAIAIVRSEPELDTNNFPGIITCAADGHEFEVVSIANCHESDTVKVKIEFTDLADTSMVKIQYKKDTETWSDLDFENGIVSIGEPDGFPFKDSTMKFRLLNENPSKQDSLVQVTIKIFNVDDTDENSLAGITLSTLVKGKPDLFVATSSVFPDTVKCADGYDFAITSMANCQAGTMVKAKIEFTDLADTSMVKIQYDETYPGIEGWYDLKFENGVAYFGPIEGGFPFADNATSRFKIFNNNTSTQDSIIQVKVTIFDMATGVDLDTLELETVVTGRPNMTITPLEENTICVDKTLTLKGSVTNGTFLRWTSSDITIAQIEEDTLTGVGEGSVNVFYVATTEHGCLDSIYTNVSVINCANFAGTVFPFVQMPGSGAEIDAFNNDTNFAVTVSLKKYPEVIADSSDLIEAIVSAKTIAMFYDGNFFIAGTPKEPGYIGGTSNKDTTGISWKDEVIIRHDYPLSDDKLAEGQTPDQPVGYYVFNYIEPGTYILEIKRKGFVTRWAKVEISSETTTLGHRELIFGDMDGNGYVEMDDAEELWNNRGYYDPSSYYFKGDVDGNSAVNTLDYRYLLNRIGSDFKDYNETKNLLE